MHNTNPDSDAIESDSEESVDTAEEIDFTEQETIEQFPEDETEAGEETFDEQTGQHTEGSQQVEEDAVDENLEENEAADDSADDDEPVDMVDQLSRQLAESQEKYLRLRAEMDNLRKRTSRDMNDARIYAKISTIDEILPVMDQFQMAVSAMDNSHDTETIKQGMAMILNTFNSSFDSLGLKAIDNNGKFDPNIHEAVSSEASDEIEADHIIRVWKAGYMLGDKLIRPSTVVISSGPAALESVEESNADSITDNEEEEPEEIKINEDEIILEGTDSEESEGDEDEEKNENEESV